jgi:hypothetical protein
MGGSLNGSFPANPNDQKSKRGHFIRKYVLALPLWGKIIRHYLEAVNIPSVGIM